MQSAGVYLLILFIVLAGFTQAFWLLSSFDTTLPWGTVQEALLTSFFNLLGQNISQSMSGLASPKLATVLIVAFMVILIIFMLNMLIAFLSNTFSSLQEDAMAVWRKEQASMLIEESFLFKIHSKRVHPYIHVLKYAADLVDRDSEKVNNAILDELVELSKQCLEPYTELQLKKEEQKQSSSSPE